MIFIIFRVSERWSLPVVVYRVSKDSQEIPENSDFVSEYFFIQNIFENIILSKTYFNDANRESCQSE